MSSVQYDEMSYEWVLGFFDPRSDRGKSIQAHAEHGIGYIIQNPDRLKTDKIIAAFKFPSNQPLPAYLQKASPIQVERLEKRSKRGA